MSTYESMSMLGSSELSLLLLFSLVALILKGFGLWHSARNNQNWWFVLILVLNTIGILPLVYMLFFRADREKIDFFGKKRTKQKKRKSRK